MLAGFDYLYFTSDKSQIEEVGDYIENTYNVPGLFTDAKKIEVRQCPNSHANYMTDRMIYKIHNQ